MLLELCDATKERIQQVQWIHLPYVRWFPLRTRYSRLDFPLYKKYKKKRVTQEQRKEKESE